MRPFAAGDLVRRSPSAADLAPLATFGATTWAQARLMYGPSAVTVSIRPRRSPPGSPRTRPRVTGAAFGPDERALVERLVGR